MLREAIERYHQLLTDERAAESQELLDSVQRRRGLTFGQRPLCTVLRPRFLTPDQFRLLQDRVRLLLLAFDRAYRRALADRTFRAQFRLLDREESLLEHDPGFASSCPTSRLDAFFAADGELKFTEFNAETPAAAAYQDALSDVFMHLPIMREFQRAYRVSPLPARTGVFHVLLDAYRQFSRGSNAPRVAIVDWREVPTYSEFVLFNDYFQSQGLDSAIVDPRELEYSDGQLSANGRPIDLVYKRVLISELLENGGTEQPLVRAVRDHAVCMVNPFRCKLLYKKASFAVLSDERNTALFDAAELSAIRAHVPWTRVMEDRHTELDGRTVDLVPHILTHAHRFVLKPNDDYGGRGITLGWLVSGVEWERAVHAALNEPYVVQERIRLPSEPYASYSGGHLEWRDCKFDTAPFACYGTYMDSCLTRIATSDLLNVTAGGGSTVPTFLIEPR